MERVRPATPLLIYIPATDQNGADTFAFKVNDGNLDSNVAVVSIMMNPVNDGPVATDDFYITGKDTALSVAAPGLLGNDNDARQCPEHTNRSAGKRSVQRGELHTKR